MLKMKVLQCLLFIFRSLILPLSKKRLTEIQRLFEEFVWEGKRRRIKNLIRQQKRAQGGLGLPHIALYQQAALTENLMQWWNQANRGCGKFEQLNTKVPLSERALMAKDQPKTRTPNCTAGILMQFGQKDLCPIIFRYIPVGNLYMASAILGSSNYDNWKRVCMCFSSVI